jgi:hypothetical protein
VTFSIICNELTSPRYQPFLYYLIHARPTRVHQQTNRLNEEGPAATLHREPSSVLWNLILRGIECNLTILETRSLPHRHHGLWYDLRAIMTASLILLAIIRAGYIDLIPGGAATLVGATEAWSPAFQHSRSLSSERGPLASSTPIRGKFGKVLAQLNLWSVESPDMRLHAEVLETLIREIIL